MIPYKEMKIPQPHWSSSRTTAGTSRDAGRARRRRGPRALRRSVAGLAFFDGPGGTQVPGRGDRRDRRLPAHGEREPRRRRSTRAARPRRSSTRRAAAAGRLPRLLARRGRLRREHDDAQLRADARGRRASCAPATRSSCTRLDHDGNVAPWLELAHDRDLDRPVRASIDDECRLDLDRPRARSCPSGRASSRSRGPRTRSAR